MAINLTKRLYIYEAVVCDKDGATVESVFFSSHLAAKKFSPSYGHVACIAQWPVYTVKDV